MAEPGLSLNFASADFSLPAQSVPKFKGGSWRERVRLNKAAKSASAARLAARQEHRPEHTEPQVKRRRIDQPRNDRPFKDRPAHLKDATYNNGPPGTREVISSLFSYNPEAKTVEEVKEEVEQEPVRPSNAPLPDGIDTFTSLGLSETIAAHLLTKMELKTPTAIQRAAVSQLTKEESDVFIQSETGSGKTLAYLLPIVERLITMAERHKHEVVEETQTVNRDSGLFAIIIAPTRELCKQIAVVLEKLLGCAHYLVAGAVIGGEKKKSEKARLRKGLNILVATPGRLVDHLENTKTLDVSKVRYLVLDEGDRLMELGFEEDITKIIRALDGKKRSVSMPGLPQARINVLCSATLKANVNKLGTISLKDAVLVKGEKGESNGEMTDDKFLAPAQLKQSYIICAAKLRLVTLTALLKRTFARKGSVMKAIVFFSCADSVDFHHKILTGAQIDTSNEKTASDVADQVAKTAALDPSLVDAVAPAPLLSSPENSLTVYRLHGSLPQQSRTSILKTFAKSTTPSLLLATDVASRGLDLPNLDLVIEYDPAFSKEDHLHRIGRTARLGRDGRAIIFLLPGSEEGYIQILRESYKTSPDTTSSTVTSTSASEVLKRGFTPTSGLIGSKAAGTDHETQATNFQLAVERRVLSDPHLKQAAKTAFQSHVRAYATHTSSERIYFDIKNLHLGHLAKSFGLRDPPAKINVVGLRSNGKDRKGRTTNTGAAGAGAVVAGTTDVDVTEDPETAAQKMRALVRDRNKMMGGGAGEFNIA